MLATEQNAIVDDDGLVGLAVSLAQQPRARVDPSSLGHLHRPTGRTILGGLRQGAASRGTQTAEDPLLEAICDGANHHVLPKMRRGLGAVGISPPLAQGIASEMGEVRQIVG